MIFSHQCEFEYRGVGFKIVESNSEKALEYYDVYFCKKCALYRVVKLDYDHTFDKIRFGATPIPDFKIKGVLV